MSGDAPAKAPIPSYAGAFVGVAEEARRAAELCHRLQESAMHLLDSYSGPDRARLMGELQHLDAVTQVLDALSTFTHSAAEQARADQPMDFTQAVRGIGLSDMAYRLRLAYFENFEEEWRLDAESGEIDMF